MHDGEDPRQPSFTAGQEVQLSERGTVHAEGAGDGAMSLAPGKPAHKLQLHLPRLNTN